MDPSDTAVNGVTSGITPEELAATGRLLLDARGSLELRVSGGSMGATLPAGSRVRVERVGPDGLRPGAVVLLNAGPRGCATHRVVARARDRGGRRYVLTRGDALVLVDTPVAEDRVIGVVTALEAAGRWTPLRSAPRRSPLRRGAAGLHARLMLMAVQVDVRLARRFAGWSFRVARLFRRLLPPSSSASQSQSGR